LRGPGVFFDQDTNQRVAGNGLHRLVRLSSLAKSGSTARFVTTAVVGVETDDHLES
jgi:hypothetical protein